MLIILIEDKLPSIKSYFIKFNYKFQINVFK